MSLIIDHRDGKGAYLIIETSNLNAGSREGTRGLRNDAFGLLRENGLSVPSSLEIISDEDGLTNGCGLIARWKNHDRLVRKFTYFCFQNNTKKIYMHIYIHTYLYGMSDDRWGNACVYRENDLLILWI